MVTTSNLNLKTGLKHFVVYKFSFFFEKDILVLKTNFYFVAAHLIADYTYLKIWLILYFLNFKNIWKDKTLYCYVCLTQYFGVEDAIR